MPPKLINKIKKLIDRFRAFGGLTTHNSQAIILSAAVNEDSIFVHWFVSHNLRKEGEYLLAKINCGKVVWMLRDANELILLAGDKFILVAEESEEWIKGRSVDDGRELFRASRDYVACMIAPGISMRKGSEVFDRIRMQSDPITDVLASLSIREDASGQAVADPGFDHSPVATPLLNDAWLQLGVAGKRFGVTSSITHWHHEPMGNRMADCFLTGTVTVSGY